MKFLSAIKFTVVSNSVTVAHSRAQTKIMSGVHLTPSRYLHASGLQHVVTINYNVHRSAITIFMFQLLTMKLAHGYTQCVPYLCDKFRSLKDCQKG